jgi:hypothetical protein
MAPDANLPAIVDEASLEPLAPRAAPEDQHVRGDEARLRRGVDPQAASEACAVEQNGLLRQPFEPGALPKIEIDVERRSGAGATVGLFGRLRGDHRGRAGLQAHRDLERIAADDAPARVEQHGARQLAGRGARHEDAKRRLLKEPCQMCRSPMGEHEPRHTCRRGGIRTRHT